MIRAISRRGAAVRVWPLLLALSACGNASSSEDSNGAGGANSAGANSAGTHSVGGAGASAGDSAGAGREANGGAGGGVAGVTNGGSSTGGTVQCAAQGVVVYTTDPQVQKTVQGTNGTFVDSCDAQGNLTDYYCETMQTCTFPTPQPDPLPMCTSMNTGKVVSNSYDCSGHCMNGTCSDRCPTFGDVLTYVTVDAATGAATFENQTDHRRYGCQLTFDASGDTYDCKTGPSVGLAVKMTAQGLKSWTCTGGDFGALGIGPTDALSTDPPTCDYDCVIPPG
jgi:hypothetical protein